MKGLKLKRQVTWHQGDKSQSIEGGCSTDADSDGDVHPEGDGCKEDAAERRQQPSRRSTLLRLSSKVKVLASLARQRTSMIVLPVFVPDNDDDDSSGDEANMAGESTQQESGNSASRSSSKDSKGNKPLGEGARQSAGTEAFSTQPTQRQRLLTKRLSVISGTTLKSASLVSEYIFQECIRKTEYMKRLASKTKEPSVYGDRVWNQQRDANDPDALLQWYKHLHGEDSDASSSSASGDDSDSSAGDKHSHHAKDRSEQLHKHESIPMTASRIARRDKAVQLLQMEIMDFWQCIDVPEGSSTKEAKLIKCQSHLSKVALVAGFKAIALEVHSHKRHSRSLAAELSSLSLRRELLAGPKAHAVHVDQDEKRESCANFWKLYHADKNASVKKWRSSTELIHECKPKVFNPASKASPHLNLPHISSSSSTGILHRPPTTNGMRVVKRSESKNQKLPWKPNNRHTLQSTMNHDLCTRKLVSHRREVHQQRVHQHSLELKNARATWHAAPAQPKPLDSSSDEEEVELPIVGSQHFDAGGFLDPGVRIHRCNQFREQAERALNKKSGNRFEKHKQAKSRTSTCSVEVLPQPQKVKELPVLMKSSASDSCLLKSEVPDLPPVFGITNPFKAPKSESEVRVVSTSPDTAAIQYIRACRAEGIMPSPFVSVLAKSGILAASGKGLVDADLFAVSTTIPKLESLCKVDLSSNTLLTDDGLTMFLKQCYSSKVTSSLTSLNLESCRGLGRRASDDLVSLLGGQTSGLHRLRHLNLSSCALPTHSLLPLCIAIRDHQSLYQVHMAECELCRHPKVCQCISELLLAPSLELLNLGWNWFSAEVFETLGNSVCAHPKLKTLLLASCSGSHSSTGQSPISVFLECLNHDQGLTTLDVSLNQIDAKGALVLEDALDNHSKLTKLLISQNPLGMDGMRCFLRLLSRSSSGLLQFDCSSCYSPVPGESHDAFEEPSFNISYPCGRYQLDLRCAYGRAVLRMLYKRCEWLQIKPERAFCDLHYTTRFSHNSYSALMAPQPGDDSQNSMNSIHSHNYRHPAGKDEHGYWHVPSGGLLCFSFSIDEAIEKRFNFEDEHGCPTAAGLPHVQKCTTYPDAFWNAKMPSRLGMCFLKAYTESVRIKPCFTKVVPLLMQFKSLKGNFREQELLVNALSHDFQLTFAQVEQMHSVRSATLNVVPKLLHCLTTPCGTYLTICISSCLQDYVKTFSACHKFLMLNSENPTAHYTLDLGNPSEYAVAQAVLLLDHWESIAAKRRGCVDSSMHGTWSGIRNAYYANQYIKNLREWHLPPRNHVGFSFSSWRRPPVDCRPIFESTWQNMLVEVRASTCRTIDKLSALHAVSSQIFIDSAQLRELLGSFDCSCHRSSAISSFIFRLTDPQNMKIFRARLADVDEKQVLSHRLGTIVNFPFLQPEETWFSFDLSTYEGRLATNTLLQIAFHERVENIRQPSLLRPDGTYFDFVMGVPLSWEQLEYIPTSGQFSCRYVCAPEDRKLHLRYQFARTLGGWRVNQDGHRINWWSALAEMPEEVRECVMTLLYYIIRDFPGVWAFWRKTQQHGQMNLQQLQNSVKSPSLKWKKLSRNEEMTVGVFRFLDPDESGVVSVHEWAVMHQLWKELTLSILEFLQYVDRTFSGNFENAWYHLDEDGSGTIDFEEWEEAVRVIGYFGEGKEIYNYCCDKSGTITKENGWQKLVDLWKDREKVRHELFDADFASQSRASF